MSKTANETTQPTKAPLWREARYAGQTWREESSDIKLESTKGSSAALRAQLEPNFTISRQEPDDAKVSRPDLSTSPEA